MVKISWAVNLKVQQIFKLNEHFLVVDRIQKVAHNMRQSNGWLKNKLLNPSGDGVPVPPPLISSEGSAPTKQSIGPQV